MTFREEPTRPGTMMSTGGPVSDPQSARAMAGPFRPGDFPPTAQQMNELVAASRYPNKAERTVRVVKDLLASLALLLASVLMVLLLSVVIAIGHRLGQVSDDLGTEPGPEPTVTGCPFGPDQCGG